MSDSQKQDAKLQADINRLLRIAENIPVAKPRVNWISRVIKLLFTLTLVVIIPLMWYFGYIDTVSINRIGIIFNFVAGFLIAPELLFRLELLQAFELKLERVFTQSELFIQKKLFLINIFVDKHLFIPDVVNKDSRFISVMTLLFMFYSALQIFGLTTAIIFAYVMMLPAIIISSVSILISEIKIHKSKPLSLFSSFILLFCLCVISPFIVLFLLLAFAVVRAAFYLIELISRIIQYILARLNGDGRLRAILISLGVVLFIIGNGLQFISTF